NVTKRLGRARELDALALLIDERRRDGATDGRVLILLSAVLARERSAARDELADALPLTKLERLANALDRVADQVERRADATKTDRATRWALEARVARRAARLLSAIEYAGNLYASHRLHDVRIALKKLRYAIELLAQVEPQTADADLATL